MPIGIPELIVILVIALVIFGPKKIPEIANSLGRSINEFKRGSREVEASFQGEPRMARPELEAGPTEDGVVAGPGKEPSNR